MKSQQKTISESLDNLRTISKSFLEQQVEENPDPEFIAWSVKKNIKPLDGIEKLIAIVRDATADPAVRLQAAKVSYNLTTDTGDNSSPSDAEKKILEESR